MTVAAAGMASGSLLPAMPHMLPAPCDRPFLLAGSVLEFQLNPFVTQYPLIELTPPIVSYELPFPISSLELSIRTSHTHTHTHKHTHTHIKRTYIMRGNRTTVLSLPCCTILPCRRPNSNKTKLSQPLNPVPSILLLPFPPHIVRGTSPSSPLLTYRLSLVIGSQ